MSEEKITSFFKTHRYKIVGGALGFILAVGMIYWGFWYTVLTLVIMAVGVFVGSLFDSGDLFDSDDDFTS